jgi:addiction module RelE/StbE family toxin
LKIKWSNLALEDLENLHGYIAAENPRAARVVLSKIRNIINSLKSHPKLGRLGRVKGTREIVIVGTPFIAAYYIEKNDIVVVAVIHASRRWPDKF